MLVDAAYHLNDINWFTRNDCKACLIGIRLTEGDTVWDGRLEIEYRPSRWGTLCNNVWTWEAAAVACHQLSMGPPLAHLFPLSPDFSLPIVYDSAVCNGDESHLSDCNLSLVNIGACHHSQDVTLRCTPDVNYQDFDVVTVEISTTTMEIGNLVLIYFENSWHTLCDETWNSLATTTLCNQLGQGQGEHSYSAEVPQIFHLYKCLPQYPSCSGSEDHLNECKWIDSAGQPAENKLYLHVKCQSSLISSNQGRTPPMTHPMTYLAATVFASDNLGLPNLAKAIKQQRPQLPIFCLLIFNILPRRLHINVTASGFALDVIRAT
ncbi:putative neurotrypsin-like [Apostichopus japonicus]|uniref:Putative neurotrypsin-like n=1 Tax=Stichopus japonicus TaxID=307972 RepID=A0A2G8KZ55_STIJA|nr:putative neurotrypsin-like [Apostichopus japonicus]